MEVLILRRRAGGANWIRADELPPDRLGPAGAHILRVFAAQDYLAERPEDADLLDGTFALAAHDLLEQVVQFREGVWALEEISVSLQDGLGFRAGLDPTTVELLTGLDGTRKLGRVAEEVARRKQVDRSVLERDAPPAWSEGCSARASCRSARSRARTRALRRPRRPSGGRPPQSRAGGRA